MRERGIQPRYVVLRVASAAEPRQQADADDGADEASHR